MCESRFGLSPSEERAANNELERYEQRWAAAEKLVQEGMAEMTLHLGMETSEAIMQIVEQHISVEEISDMLKRMTEWGTEKMQAHIDRLYNQIPEDESTVLF